MAEKNRFLDFMGYRNIIVEEKIKEWLSAYRLGEASLWLVKDDLTDEEAQYIQREVRRRIENDNYRSGCFRSIGDASVSFPLGII